MQKIVLIGGGGHCLAAMDVIEHEKRFFIHGILDREEKVGQNAGAYRIIGTDEDIPELSREGYSFLVTVGQIKSGRIRHSLFEQVQSVGGGLPAVVSPMGYVSKGARLGQGTIVMHRAVVGPGSRVGDNGIINTGAIIEHGAAIGSHCHVATGAIINGDAVIGNHCFIGSGAVIGQGIRIGDHTLVSAGVTLLKDAGSGITIKG